MTLELDQSPFPCSPNATGTPADPATWSAVRALVLEDLREEADEARDAALDFRIDPPPVHRVVSVDDASLLAPAGPASVFDLCERPVKWRCSWSGPQAATTARRIERLEGITRCINYPLIETAEWQERELQRRARQRPPRNGTRKVKEAIRHWGLFKE